MYTQGNCIGVRQFLGEIIPFRLWIRCMHLYNYISHHGTLVPEYIKHRLVQMAYL